MSTCNQDFFSTWKNTLNDIELPTSPESISRSDSGMTTKDQENCLRSLLSTDETILKNLEFDDNKTKTNLEEKNSPNNSWFDQDLNKSRFYSDRLSQNINDHDLTFWENEEFKKCNESIYQELNESVNLVKTKLFDLPNDTTIPRKKKKTNLNDSCVLPYKNSFYGLPIKLKEMVKKYRGIDKLYGKFV